MRRLQKPAELAEAIRSWHKDRNVHLFLFDDSALSLMLFIALRVGAAPDEEVAFGSINYIVPDDGRKIAFGVLVVPKRVDVDAFLQEALEMKLAKRIEMLKPHHDLMILTAKHNDFAAHNLLAEAISGYDGGKPE